MNSKKNKKAKKETDHYNLTSEIKVKKGEDIIIDTTNLKVKLDTKHFLSP